MMIPKTFIFFAVSCITAVSSASLDNILHSGNGNYIIQLNQTTCIKHFVPRFIDGAFNIFSQSIGHDKLERRNHNRIVRRDTQDDQVHVFDAYDIGSKFKGIGVKFEDLNIVKTLLASFDHEILRIIPDQDIKFDLPTNKKKSQLRKRYYIRASKKTPSERQGNFDYDHYDHDENCPYASKKKTHDLDKRATTSKKTTTKKTTKKTSAKKKTTTKKITSVKNTATSSCYPGSFGKKKGDGYKGYCCSTEADCKDDCIGGKCNGPVNTKTTTKTTTTKTGTTKGATATTSSAPSTSNCYPGSFGKKKGDGYKGYCCSTEADCKDDCISGKCNGPVNTKTTAITTTAAKTTTTNAAATTTTTTTKTTITTKIATTTTTSTAVATQTVSAAGYTKQTGAQWNLVRISEHKLDLSKPYIYDSNAGSDAYVYVVDDGMNVNHVEFEGRATWGWSAYTGVSPLGEGHGTHVAGIIGSKTYGVAKKTNLIAVQVLGTDGTGSITSILAGLQWVLNDAAKYKGKALINMSLGLQTGGNSNSLYTAFDTAITSLVQSGVPLFAAAGNWATDSCQVLPAGNKNVYSVAATDNTDAMAWYSCYGTCVSIFAPGSDIISTYITSNTATTSMSGTSMSSPHVAGVAALLIGGMNNPTPTDVYNKITSLATKNVISAVVNNTPNSMLFNGQQLTTN